MSIRTTSETCTYIYSCHVAVVFSRHCCTPPPHRQHAHFRYAICTHLAGNWRARADRDGNLPGPAQGIDVTVCSLLHLSLLLVFSHLDFIPLYWTSFLLLRRLSEQLGAGWPAAAAGQRRALQLEYNMTTLSEGYNSSFPANHTQLRWPWWQR